MDLSGLTAVELGEKIKSGEVKVIDAVDFVYDRIKKEEMDVNSFITICDKNEVIEQAMNVQKKIDSKELTSKLAGVPIAIKDNICTENIKTTCGSKMLADFVPQYSADVIERLKKSGAIIIGKTNMDEFGMGSTTETSYWGATRNPRNKAHVPGGSSGGSCAALVTGECFGALGTDTGGSIRQPSSYCGVVGLKSTYGMVSRYGLVAYASSLEQIGPIGKDVADCAAMLEIIAGYDEKDSTSINLNKTAENLFEDEERTKNNSNNFNNDIDIDDTNHNAYNFTSALINDIKGLKIGIPRNYFNNKVDVQVRDSVLKAIDVLKKKGAIVEEFDLEMAEYAVPSYYVIASAQASSNLARFDGVKYGYRAKEYEGLHDMYKKSRTKGFGEEVKRRIMLGSFVLSQGYYDAYYLKAIKIKNLIKDEFDKVFKKYDVIIGPVSPTTAPKLNESLKEPIKMYMSDVFTVSVNLVGLPAISIPCGVDNNGLPIGMQIIGDSFKEKDIIRVAYTYEQSCEIS